MRRSAATILIVATALAATASGIASTSNRARVIVNCAHQSFASFPGGFSDSRNLVVGPLAMMGARDLRSGAYNGAYRWKNPVILEPGHTVTMRIGAEARRFAGLHYFAGGGGWGYKSSARTVVFKACPARSAGSMSDRGKVTFWSGGLSSKRAPVCVPIEFRVDGGRVRHRTLALEGARCGN